MSMEESMKALAESNNNLAESQNKLADTMGRYADVIERNAALVVTNGGQLVEKPKADAEPEKKPRGKAKAEDKPKDDDLGKAPKLTEDEVKGKLLELRDLHDDKAPALKILGEYGYESFNDLKPADFQAVYDDAVAAIKKFKASRDL